MGYTMEKKWLASFPAVLPHIVMFLFMVNRFCGMCGEISDFSVVKLCETDPGQSPRLRHECNRNLTPSGREYGFLSMTRTFPVHILSGVVHVISILVILLAAWIRWGSPSDDKDNTKRRLSSKPRIAQRTLLLIFLFGIISLLYGGATFLAMNGECQPDHAERVAGQFCLITGSIDLVLQSQL